MSTKQRFTFEKLHSFISNGDHVSVNHILKWEHHKSEIFQMKNNEGLTLTHQACLSGHLKCLDVLLNHGANIHVKSSVGWTPLHAATLGGHFDVVEFLLKECSADPLAKDNMNCLPCDLTMETSILDILKEFTEKIILKQNFDKAASKYSDNVIRRPRSRTQTPRDSPIISRNRPKSMFVNEIEAEKIRTQLMKTRPMETKKEKVKKHSLFLTPDYYTTTQDENTNTHAQPYGAEQTPLREEEYKEIVITIDENATRRSRDSGVFEYDASEGGLYEGFMKEHEEESHERHFSVI